MNSKLKTLNFSRFRFTLRFLDSILLRKFHGSTIQGGVGNAFNIIAYTCDNCKDSQQCSYDYISENPNAPKPFVLETQIMNRRYYESGEEFSFDLILIGKATACIICFINTVKELSKIGLGRKRAKFILEKVSYLPFIFQNFQKNVYSNDDDSYNTNFHPESFNDILNMTNGIQAERVEINFLTHTRLKMHEHFIAEPDFYEIMECLMRRLSALNEYYGETQARINYELLTEAAKIIITEKKDYIWRDDNLRISKNKPIKLGGIVGRGIYTGKLTPFIPYLLLGKQLHIGKNSSFGLGRFDIKFWG